MRFNIEGEVLDLVESTRRYNLNDTNAVRTLIGLGTGLTPSYEDFLVGYLAGLWCTARVKASMRDLPQTWGRRFSDFTRIQMTLVVLTFTMLHVARFRVCWLL
jgi:hypothetical protein